MMRGIKNNPLRDAARMLARIVLRTVWVNILLIMSNPPKGRVQSCQRKATVPTAITAGSWRKMPMIPPEKIHPVMLQTKRNAVVTLIENQYPLFTRS